MTADPCYDWRNCASEAQKLRAIRTKFRIFWDEITTLPLWYAVGEIDGLTEGDTQDIIVQMFCNAPEGNEIDFYPIDNIPGHRMLMRVHGLAAIRPALELRGQRWPLFQIGGEHPGALDDPRTLNFQELWKTPPEQST